MKYAVEISDTVQVELDVAPGAPSLRRVVLEWETPQDELAATLERLGGRHGQEAFSRTGAGAWVRVRVPLTCDGEKVGVALVRVWALPDEPAPDPHEVAADEVARLGAAPGGGRW